MERRCLLGANPLGDALSLAFERGQIEIRFTMHLGCNRLYLGGHDAPLSQQARGSAAGA